MSPGHYTHVGKSNMWDTIRIVGFVKSYLPPQMADKPSLDTTIANVNNKQWPNIIPLFTLHNNIVSQRVIQITISQ